MAAHYVKVAQTSDLKLGDLTIAKVGEVEVMIANVDGEFYAV